ncbi:MAG: hypothetical protein FP824_03785 [Euryarchaeota archaeon]|nr:hypothetical protein [Euryarchaeota archaeon]MBU4143321.1 hypothetical protein [Candidatus Thermoplasmatota archaeon]
MTKKITAKILGTGSPVVKDLNIKEKTTPADVKRVINVPQTYQVYRVSTKTFLKDGQDLHGLLEEHEKLEISPESELGWLGEKISSLFFSVEEENKIEVTNSWSMPPLEVGPQPFSYVQPPQAMPRLEVSVEPAELIGAQAEMANIEWFPTDEGYAGFYTTWAGRKYQGKMSRKWSLFPRYYIKDPPPNIFSGRHSHCFSIAIDGWYHCHFAKGAGNNPLTLIRKVEEYLNDTEVCS